MSHGITCIMILNRCVLVVTMVTNTFHLSHHLVTLMLLQYGANKDAENQKRETPLYLASREGKLEVSTRALVAFMTTRNRPDQEILTPDWLIASHVT